VNLHIRERDSATPRPRINEHIIEAMVCRVDVQPTFCWFYSSKLSLSLPLFIIDITIVRADTKLPIMI